MSPYQHILLAVELEEASDTALAKKTNELLNQFDAKVTLVHAVEHLNAYGSYYTVAAGVDVEEMTVNDAKKAMEDFVKKLQKQSDENLVIVGHPSQVILQLAEEKKCDLIVIGSHGRRGLRLLLGSTANAVLHGAKCDVLAIRVHDK